MTPSLAATPNKTRLFLTQHGKGLILLLLCIFGLLTRFMLINVSKEAVTFSFVDTSWYVDLSHQLEQGNWVGRDIHFTIGPLSQLLAWAEVKLQGGDPLSAYPIQTILSWTLGLIVLYVTLCLIDEFDWLGSSVAFILIYILTLYWFWRPIWALAAVVFLSRAVGTNGKRRFLFTVLAGVFGFIGQVISFDTGLLALLAGGFFILFWLALASVPQGHPAKRVGLDQPLAYVKIGALFGGSFLILNLALELYFKTSGPLYTWFDYWYYGLKEASRYGYGFALDWLIDYPAARRPLLTAAILLLGVYLTVSVALKFRNQTTPTNLQTLYTFTGLLIFAIINFKSATLRSDAGHVLRGSVGLIFLLCLSLVAKDSSRNNNLIGLCILALLVGLWPSNIINSMDVWPKILRQQTSFSAKWQAIRDFALDPAIYVPAGLANALDENKLIVAFPFDNVVTVAMDRYSFAPVLQTEMAFDSELQQHYAEKLAEQQTQIEVIYRLDFVDPTLGVIRMNGVQNIARVPIIFEYLAENFTLKEPEPFGSYLVLQPRPAALPLQRVALSFDSTQPTNQLAEVQLTQPQNCPLVELELETRYPLLTSLGRANGLMVRAFNNSQPIFQGNLVPIESTKPYSVFVYLGPIEGFKFLFSPDRSGAPPVSFDRLTLTTGPVSLFDVQPDTVQIRQINCIN